MISEKANGELGAKIGEEISDLVLSNISLITKDVEQAIKDRDEGQEFGEVTGAVKFKLGSAPGETFKWELNLEWQRSNKTKIEAVKGEYDPLQPPLIPRETKKK
jgi:hypothetical protein